MRVSVATLIYAVLISIAAPSLAVPMPFPNQPFGGSKSCALPNSFVVPEGFSPGGALHGLAGVTSILPGPNGGLFPTIAYDPLRIAELIRKLLASGGTQGDANLVVAFLAYHECAHARLGGPPLAPHDKELAANCEALRQMRALGYVGPNEEIILTTFHKSLGDMGPPYGDGQQFWGDTLKCANSLGAPSVLDQRIL